MPVSLVIPQGTISVGIDATDLFDRYDEEYEDVPGSSFPQIEINKMHISQSIEVRRADAAVWAGHERMRHHGTQNTLLKGSQRDLGGTWWPARVGRGSLGPAECWVGSVAFRWLVCGLQWSCPPASGDAQYPVLTERGYVQWMKANGTQSWGCA